MFFKHLWKKKYINRMDKVMLTKIKKLLKIPIRTNNDRLKIALDLSNLNNS
jgi:hypothetical protein